MTYTHELELLYGKIRQEIITAVRRKGVESEFTQDKVILFSNQVSLDKINISELGEDIYRDTDGLEYSYSTLSYEDLALIGDYLRQL